ncbi:YflJ family protein [Paraliobacillus salinarum]|nr:YflJ family protein [Paraliobacillus salinarum]
MHIGSKGWYVEQLKRIGIRRLEGRKIEKFKTPVLANLLDEKQN